MIEEAYISFETAKLLIRKGLNHSDCHCDSYYTLGEEVVYWKDKPNALNVAPRLTLAVAMRWLREVHGLFISIGNDDLDYSWQIFDIKNRTKDLDPICLTDSYGGYRKYELACTLAIKYCLENLIKL